MEILFPRCAGLDVHKDSVVACVRIVEPGTARAKMETRTFGTTTGALMELADWLAEQDVKHAVMEATGVYWKPVWHILADSVELTLGNAHHLRSVPGRKSDVADAVWLADLMAHGLVRGSFIPPEPIAALRDFTRTRKQLVREQARHSMRIQKTLEDMNIKLGSVISNVMGVSGRAMLKAIIGGETDPAVLARLAHGTIRASQEELVEALRGKVDDRHRMLLRVHLSQFDSLQTSVDELDAQIDENLRPFRDAAKRLTAIPGIDEIAASTILSEIGADMARFPTAGHLVSWAGLCPAMDESAGKRRSTRTRKGAPWLKTLLVQCAWAAARTKKTYFRAKYQRLASRRGPKKAAVAVAASMLTTVYHMLRDGAEYQDLGVDYFDRRSEVKTVGRLQRRIRELGYEVEVRKIA